MFPTFHNGEYVLTDLIALKLGDVKRGDVVVFIAPPDHEKDFIKRIIGLPGDTISLNNGYVYLNNQKLAEGKYLNSSVKTYGEGFLKDGQTITVPQDEYFVLGDNRSYSSDSRDWGFVQKNELIGESFFVYWPPSRIRFVANP